MPTQNDIGDLGENLFSVIISRDYNFRSRHLGEKWPTSDFYVELIGPKEHFFFIVQVKSTNQGINRDNKLRINVPKDKLHKLNNYFCPTYVVGIDVITEKAYIVSVNTKRRKAISSLSTKYEINTITRSRLFDDVKKFWTDSNVNNFKSTFKHSI